MGGPLAVQFRVAPLKQAGLAVHCSNCDTSRSSVQASAPVSSWQHRSLSGQRSGQIARSKLDSRPLWTRSKHEVSFKSGSLGSPWQKQRGRAQKQKRCKVFEESSATAAGPEPEAGTKGRGDDLLEFQLTMKGLKNADPDVVLRLEQELLATDGVEAVHLTAETESCLLTMQPTLLPIVVMEKISAMQAGVLALPYKEHSWTWRGHKVAYSVAGCGKPLIMVHGFGGTMGQYRKLVALLAGQYRVYALDLIGFGASAKPKDLEYNPILWGQLVKDFAEEFAGEPAVLVGNSIGSLATLTAAANAGPGSVQGLILLNCPGGMNRKGIQQEEPMLQRMAPLFEVFEWLLKKPLVSNFLFDRFRNRANVKRILLEQVYCNKEAVSDDLVEMIFAPSEDAGALEVFVDVFTGNPGPRPETLVEKIDCPILILWGEQDAWMPVGGPVGQFFVKLAEDRDNVRFIKLPDVGHCPQDDRPELVAAEMLPWLRHVWKS